MKAVYKLSIAAAIYILIFLTSFVAILAHMLELVRISDNALRFLALTFLISLFIAGLLALGFIILVAKYVMMLMAKSRAKRIAQSPWYVKGVVKYPNIGTMLLHTADRLPRLSVRLHYRRGHPDFERLAELKDPDLIEFEFSQRPVGQAGNESDFLTIKEAISYT